MESNARKSTDAKQYIVVKLGDEQFGINIEYVDNIVRMQRITRVPKAQNYFNGVINIRGEIIPVMSLRTKFNLEEDVFQNDTRILILKLDQEPQSAVGIIVDQVKEVVTLDEEHIDKVSNNNAPDERTASYLSGVGKHAEGLISVLNIADVVGEKEVVL